MYADADSALQIIPKALKNGIFNNFDENQICPRGSLKFPGFPWGFPKLPGAPWSSLGPLGSPREPQEAPRRPKRCQKAPKRLPKELPKSMILGFG